MMPKSPFDFPSPFDTKPKRKRVTPTASDKIYVWGHPEIYGRTCSICGKKITKITDLEFDHTKPFSKGGKKLALTHRDCNRKKGSRSLKDVQKKMGLETTKKTKSKSKRKSEKKKTTSPFDVSLPKTKFPLF
jgi:5-methylcytosine-specific restriction endonuclease McrA